MLEFTQRPPATPEDVSLSESGRFLLRDAYIFRNEGDLEPLGRAICSELVDALEGSINSDTAPFKAFSRHIIELALDDISQDDPAGRTDRNGIEAFTAGVEFVESACKDRTYAT